MQKVKVKSKKLKSRFYLILAPFVFYLFTFIGCASVPVKTAGIPTYNIHGSTYLPLITLCQQNGIAYEYDTFTRNIVLKKGIHKLNLRVGEKMVLADGLPEHINHPVEFYQGAVVVPLKLKEKFIDTFFKEIPGVPQAVLWKIKKVVIDPGHGGYDPGAISKSGLKEKDVNLDIAKRLAKILRDKGIEVVMTRSSDVYVSLNRRVEIANNSGADLLLSIHSNANRVRGLNGFEVYYISTNIDDYQRAFYAAQNATLALDPDCFVSSTLNLKATLWDMLYTNNRAEAIHLARAICRNIDRNLDTRVIGIKGARFKVLRETNMPAVLLEIGFLSNREEERLLKNSYYRQQIAEAIGEGIDNYARDYTIMEASR